MTEGDFRPRRPLENSKGGHPRPHRKDLWQQAHHERLAISASISSNITDTSYESYQKYRPNLTEQSTSSDDEDASDKSDIPEPTRVKFDRSQVEPYRSGAAMDSIDPKELIKAHLGHNRDDALSSFSVGYTFEKVKPARDIADELDRPTSRRIRERPVTPPSVGVSGSLRDSESVDDIIDTPGMRTFLQPSIERSNRLMAQEQSSERQSAGSREDQLIAEEQSTESQSTGSREGLTTERLERLMTQLGDSHEAQAKMQELTMEQDSNGSAVNLERRLHVKAELQGWITEQGSTYGSTVDLERWHNKAQERMYRETR